MPDAGRNDVRRRSIDRLIDWRGCGCALFCLFSVAVSRLFTKSYCSVFNLQPYEMESVKLPAKVYETAVLNFRAAGSARF